jgi:hypothetical protein
MELQLALDALGVVMLVLAAVFGVEAVRRRVH